MKIHLDKPFAEEVMRRGFEGESPLALSGLQRSAVPEKLGFLREEMFDHLSRTPLYERCETPEDADAVFMPFNLGKIRAQHPEVERHYRDLAAKAGRPLIVDYFGDATDAVAGENTIVLRTSQYRSTLSDRDIVCPPVIEDIGSKYEIAPLARPERPSVGFVGMAEKRKAAGWLSNLFLYSRQDYLLSAAAFFASDRGRERSGLYFRKRAVDVLERDGGVDTDFILRGFWGRGKRARNVIGYEEVRRDFIENMRRNFYLLAVRGRGNFSLRFFEILSAGRIPLVLDTETPLPLSDSIDYSAFCIFVDWRRLNTLGRRLLDVHRDLSAAEAEAMQRRARDAFEKKLRFDVFARELFGAILPTRLAGR